MEILLVREERFIRTPDGVVWSRWGTSSAVWAPYLRVFDRVVVAARCETAPSNRPGWTKAGAPGVDFLELPYFRGPLQWLVRRPKLARAAGKFAAFEGAIIVRVPSPVATIVRPRLLAARRPYGVEVAGDPNDMYGPGAVRHPLRIVFRRHFAADVKSHCRHAAVVKYVTTSTLQKRYPAAPGVPVFGISDVVLPDQAYVLEPRPASRPVARRVLFVGMLEQLYKGPDVLLEAAAICHRRDFPIRVGIAGDGRMRTYLQSLAAERGIATHVDFLGVLNRAQIEKELDSADVFVLPSRQEGLPRAMLEAMARGVPCVATRVGGIPELLAPAWTIETPEPEDLAKRLTAALSFPERLAEASRTNFNLARNYHDSVRASLHDSFLRCLVDRTRDRS